VKHTKPQSRPTSLALLLTSLSLFVALIAAQSASAQSADSPGDNPNNMTCVGHTAKGPVDKDDPTSGVVSYTLGCSGKITGYILFPTRAVTGYETEVFGVDYAQKQIVASDLFSCGGDIPGFGLNCIGSTSWPWRLISSTFTINGDVCAEPRPDVVAFATFYGPNAAGVNAQALAGPFDLGRPRGCGKSASGGKTLIPADVSFDTTLQTVAAPVVVKKPVKKSVKKTAKKPAKKVAHKSSTKH
jgi:hypothetical protein